MSLKIGSNDVIDIKKGSAQILAVAVGSEIIWESGGLPSGYTKVKYLWSDGTNQKHIDTLIYPDSTTGAYLDFEVVKNTGVYAIGAMKLDVIRFCPLLVRDLYLQYEKQLTPQTILDYAPFDTNRHQIYYNYDGDSKVYFDNVEKESIGNIGTSTNDTSIYLFTRNKSNIPDGTPSVKFYNVKIKQSGVIKRDFIPCLDTNNVPCFYDTVSGNTFYNQGTGQFGYETMDGTVVAPI